MPDNPALTAEIERLRSLSPATQHATEEERDMQRAQELSEHLFGLLTRLGEEAPTVHPAHNTPWGIMAVAQVADFTLCHFGTDPQIHLISRLTLSITPVPTKNLVEMLALRDPADFIDPRDYVLLGDDRQPVKRSDLPEIEDRQRLHDVARAQDRADRDKQAQYLRTAFTPSQQELVRQPYVEANFRDTLALHVCAQLGQTVTSIPDAINLTDEIIRGLRP